jgi:hypothetical protein
VKCIDERKKSGREENGRNSTGNAESLLFWPYTEQWNRLAKSAKNIKRVRTLSMVKDSKRLFSERNACREALEKTLETSELVERPVEPDASVNGGCWSRLLYRGGLDTSQ